YRDSTPRGSLLLSYLHVLIECFGLWFSSNNSRSPPTQFEIPLT
ncbi:hypothetical protein M5D96_004287, partial [Drosophila gunungcola]